MQSWSEMQLNLDANLDKIYLAYPGPDGTHMIRLDTVRDMLTDMVRAYPGGLSQMYRVIQDQRDRITNLEQALKFALKVKSLLDK